MLLANAAAQCGQVPPQRLVPKHTVSPHLVGHSLKGLSTLDRYGVASLSVV